MGVCVSLIGLPVARGQSVGPATVNAIGGTGTISGNFYDWSIGEMTMVATFTGTDLIITQGVLQNDLSHEGVANTTLANHLLVFPNPSSSIVNVKYASAANGTLGYRLMDMAGKIIINHSARVTQGITVEQLNISQLAAAAYMLEITFDADNTAREMTSYKIEKLK